MLSSIKSDINHRDLVIHYLDRTGNFVFADENRIEYNRNLVW